MDILIDLGIKSLLDRAQNKVRALTGLIPKALSRTALKDHIDWLGRGYTQCISLQGAIVSWPWRLALQCDKVHTSLNLILDEFSGLNGLPKRREACGYQEVVDNVIESMVEVDDEDILIPRNTRSIAKLHRFFCVLRNRTMSPLV